MLHPERTVLPVVLLALIAAAAEPVKFNRDIRPIMSDTCFRCHGPDKRARMAGMRLDRREEALKPTASGATPIVPGDPEKSAIVQRIFAADPRAAHATEIRGESADRSAKGNHSPLGGGGRRL